MKSVVKGIIKQKEKEAHQCRRVWNECNGRCAIIVGKFIMENIMHLFSLLAEDLNEKCLLDDLL